MTTGDEVPVNKVHTYRSRVEWSGSTAEGYEHYERRHSASSPPSPTALHLSGDPAFGGNPEQLNPEQLLLVAASSCQLLSFLATAARARINVISYRDEADAIMPEDDKPLRITQITLRPHITIASDADEARIRRYVDLAHHECFIANSLKGKVLVEPEIELHTGATNRPGKPKEVTNG